eukprot:gene5239-biopygen12287
MQPRYEGPYLIMTHTSPLTYRLKLRHGDTRHPVFHVMLLRLFDDGTQEFPSRAPSTKPMVVIPPDHSAHPNVEAILNHKLAETTAGLAPIYLVKWQDKPEYDNSWLSATTLAVQAPALFSANHTANPDPSRPQVPLATTVTEEPTDEEVPLLPLLNNQQGEDYEDTDGNSHQRPHRLPGASSRPRRAP